MVSHLPKQFQETAIANMFRPFGTVVDCTLLRDKQGNSQRSGFVIMLTDAQAAAGMNSLNNMPVGGQMLRVTLSSAHARQMAIDPFGAAGGATAATIPSMNDGSAMTAAAAGAEAAKALLEGGGAIPLPNGAAPPKPKETHSLFVFHLPHGLDEMVLEQLFLPFGKVDNVKICKNDQTGEHKGYGFVAYTERAHAEAAIEGMNGFEIGGKHLKVSHKQ